MLNERISFWWYPIAVAAVGAALLSNLVLGAWIWPNIFPLFLIAVLLCARYGGLGPGLTATVLASAGCTILLAGDQGQIVPPAGIAVRVGMYAGIELLIVYLIVALTRAAEALRDSEANYRVMFELAGVGKFQADPATGRFIRVNRKLCEITGYSAEELLERTFRDITHPEDREWGSLAYERLARGEAVEYDSEKRYLRKDSRVVWVHVNATLMRDPEGNPLRTVAVIQDITERKRAEEATRESEQRFRAMAETVPSLIWVARHDGWTTFLNGRWYEMTGAAPEDSLGRGWAEMIHPEDRGRSIESWEASVRAGTAFEIEQRIRCADGSYRWFLSRGAPWRDDTGNIIEWFGTCTDIDDQKRMHAALIEATQAKDRFLAVLSHELRTPLTPVLLAVTAMQERVAKCAACQPTLEMIRANIELEARLIEDLLDVARIARGNMTYRFETVDMHALIRRAAEVCRGELSLKGHGLALDLAAARHHVHGDPARLQQVLWNLLTNAVKYTPDGGHITVRTRSEDHGQLIIEVLDDGVGIQPEDLARLFDAFERGYGAAAFHAGGLGLGLAICRSIAEAHRGTLTGASAGRHKGSMFTLELATISAPPDRAEPESARTAVNGRRLRILLAEDHTESARAIADVLRSKGHVITLATSLRKAVEAASGSLDLVVSDLDLGDGSGLDLMRHVRSLGDTPGIALSGYATAQDVRESLEAGFATHLAKPVTLAALESAIHDVTAQRSRRGSIHHRPDPGVDHPGQGGSSLDHGHRVRVVG